MKGYSLFFATNRNHKGRSRWNPKGYGGRFSKDGHYNLRFGELTIDADVNEVERYLKSAKNGRVGDGESLSQYLSKHAEEAHIEAYEDNTSITKDFIDPAKNSSTRLFKNLKEIMEKSCDVVIFIHGYNVSWNEAVGSAIALELMLNRGKDDKRIKVVLFSWPSDGSIMPFAAYKSDRDDARDSAQAVGRGFLKLKDYLTKPS